MNSKLFLQLFLIHMIKLSWFCCSCKHVSVTGQGNRQPKENVKNTFFANCMLPRAHNIKFLNLWILWPQFKKMSYKFKCTWIFKHFRARGYHSLVDIIVATPGRLVDHINQTQGFDLSHLRYLVTSCLFDTYFCEQLNSTDKTLNIKKSCHYIQKVPRWIFMSFGM